MSVDLLRAANTVLAAVAAKRDAGRELTEAEAWAVPLARDFLARLERAEEGRRPVSPGWLEAVGFEPMFPGAGAALTWWHYPPAPSVTVRFEDGLPVLLVGNSATGWGQAGDPDVGRWRVRQLCEALGHPLREPADADAPYG